MKSILILMGFLASQAVFAEVKQDTDGKVCLGPYGGFILNEKSHLFFTVDDSKEKIAFNDKEPRVIAQGLDPQKRHVIRVFSDSTLMQSWPVSFAKQKVTMVDIWKSPGYWHLESNSTGKCQWPREEKKESLSRRTAPRSCQSSEEAWLLKFRVEHEYSERSPSMQSVGDCWVASGNLDRARAFYRRVKSEFRKDSCSDEGEACDVFASEELRRIDCGGGWLVPSAEAAWRDFLGALEQTDPDPRSFRIEPEFRDNTLNQPPYAETCSTSAFLLPKSIHADLQNMRSQVTSSTAPWTQRFVNIAIRPEDSPWKNWTDTYHYFQLRACPATRPSAGKPTWGFYIQLSPAVSEEFDPTCD